MPVIKLSTHYTAKGGGKQPPLVPVSVYGTKDCTTGVSDTAIKAYTTDFYKVKNSGLLPVNPYSRIVSKGGLALEVFAESTLVYSPPYARDTIKGLAQDWIVVAPVLPSVVQSLYSDQKSVADNDSKERFANHVSNVILDVPTELKELKDTSDMVLHRAKQLVTYAANFRKINAKTLRGLKKFLKDQNHSGRINVSRGSVVKDRINDINGLFLEYNYGWVPLYNSFMDACEVVENYLQGSKIQKKISGKGVFEGRDIQTFVNTTVNGSSGVNVAYVAYQRVCEYKYEVWHGGILKEDASNQRATVKQQLGLSINDLPMSLLEMTYLSFIADYFSNVSGVIGNLRRAATKVYSSTYYKSSKITAKYNLEGKRVWFPNSFPAGVKASSRGYFGTALEQEIMLFSRIPVTASDLNVSFNFKDPSMDHVMKTLSVAAAVTGVFRNKV